MILNWLHKNVTFRISDLIFGQEIAPRLKFLEEAQWWDRSRIESYQKQALSSLIKIAYEEIPLYHDLMDKSGVKPGDIVMSSDLTKLPVVSKAMLKADFPARTVRKTGYRQFVASGSGSTGTNMQVMADSFSVGQAQATGILSFSWSGWRLGDSHLQFGITLNRGIQKQIKDKLLRCNYQSAYDLTETHIDQCLNILDSKKIKHLWGYPPALYLMAKRAEKVGWNQPLSAVITWGDNLFSHYREIIERVFKTKVIDTYGCGEGIHVSAQCGHGSTYHTHDFDTIVEFLNNDDQPAGRNEYGHIVLTRLDPGPMPLIRYRIGDIGIKGEELSCTCGRQLGTMQSIQGRDTDIVITPSGNRLIVHFFTGILEHYHQIKFFQVTQDKIDEMKLRIVPGAGYSDAVQNEIVSDLKAHGADLRIEVEIVSEIPPSASSKRRFVISNLRMV